MKNIIRISKSFLLLLLTAFTVPAYSQADSTSAEPTDLVSSLLVCKPGLDFYSCYGHCALRLQCPSADLDFVFSYCLDDNLVNRIGMFRGKGLGQYAAFPTDVFLKEYQETRREVKEYILNLTTEETRELWRMLDKELVTGAHRQYNFLHTNCSSMCFYALERVMQGEEIVFKHLDSGITGTYRQFVHRISEGLPWTDFFWTTILGATGEEQGPQEDKMAPMLIVKSFDTAVIQTFEGDERPFVKALPTTIVEQGFDYPVSWFTPRLLFLILLLLSMLVSVHEWSKGYGRPQRIFDGLLFVMQTVCGLFIFYLCCISDMPGASNNWNLLVFNPLPCLLWLCFRRRKAYAKAYWLYLAALLIYVALWPVAPMIDLTHVLMVSPLLVRVAMRLVQNRRS
ncbi:MAG: DUF4105 domain-containing protein [Prevotella sp.]|nr:DUF4105 domain-containing protein [Prevotella sp.]